MSKNGGAVGLSAAHDSGAARLPSRQPMACRVIAAGGAALCIGFLAEMNAPDADALAILLPGGNGNATQINILEGNLFNPQFGNGNTSNNQTIGSIIFGQGNHSSSSGATGGSTGIFGPIALGGANGNGNVTQINILSFNIINPQISLSGNNYSNNKTVSNVSVGNGNHSDNSSSSGGSLIGGAVGNGNTRQVSLFSGNIFNPQFSLFGANYSNNTAVSNISLFNGNFSNNSSTGGSGIGSGLFGALTGNGNTNQIAAGTTNIFNPQFSFLGTNWSNNNATTNFSGANGNHSNNEGSTSTNVGGANGNGNTSQSAWALGNIINEQFRLGTGQASPGVPDVINSEDVAVVGTDSTNTWLPGMPVPEGLEDFVEQGNAVVEGTNVSVAGTNAGVASSAASNNRAGSANRPRPIKKLVNEVRGAIERAADGVNKALGINKPEPAASQPSSSQPDGGNAPGADNPDGG